MIYDYDLRRLRRGYRILVVLLLLLLGIQIWWHQWIAALSQPLWMTCIGLFLRSTTEMQRTRDEARAVHQRVDAMLRRP